MADTSDQQELKWGDSFDLLSDERKRELRDRLNTWNPEQATEDHPGPFAGERLNGLEVFWLAACSLVGESGDPAESVETLSDPQSPFDAPLSVLNLSKADLTNAYLIIAQLKGINLSGGILSEAKLYGANLDEANLSKAKLIEVDFLNTSMNQAILRGADLRSADLSNVDLRSADLTGADLRGVRFINTTLEDANLSGCKVYGISVWNVKLDSAIQTNLRITPDGEAELTTDKLEMAQFLYLMLHNEKIREVIDSITSKVVLILGRFTKPRKRVLDALRDELRRRNYLPVVFDFEKPANANTTETVTLLARMARFVIADLTDPNSVPYELAEIVPDAHVPVQTLLLEGERTFPMAKDLWQLHPHLMLPLCRYATLDELLSALPDRVIAPAEAKAAELQRLRNLPVEGL